MFILYLYDIQYIRSHKNNSADALSRLSLHCELHSEPDFGYFFYLQESLPINYRKIATETGKYKVLNQSFELNISEYQTS